jgi:outer membrane protein assembly factor BamB
MLASNTTGRTLPGRSTLLRALLLSGLVAFAPGCSTVKGWLGGAHKSKLNEPVELTKLAAPIGVKHLWSTGVGDGEGRRWLRLHPTIDGDRVYAVNDRGELLALDARTGKAAWVANGVSVPTTASKFKFWKRETIEAGLSSSPGVGNGMVVVGGRNGEVIAFDAATGAKRWSVRVTSEVLSAPFVGSSRVVVRSNDGRVFGLDPADGARKWVFDRGLPTLSVRGNAAPVGSGGGVFIGYDDGSVVALREADGQRIWEQAIAEPEGRSELDRMADVDGEIVVDGDQLYVVSYHDKLMALNLSNGQPLWTHDVGSYGGVALASDRVLLSDKFGDVWAIDRSSGTSLWKQDKLHFRQLTTPVIQGDYAVVGDLEGYLHWIKLDTGDIVGRQRIEKAALRGTPQVSPGGVLYAVSNEGELAAFQLGN